jgi:glycosyltransferase involved in cell wall biosynthesis
VENFYEWHDVKILLDSFAMILKLHPDARLVLVGDGTTRLDMEAHAKDLGITQSVQFTGLLPHADVPKYIAAADIAVVPYPSLKDTIWLSPLKLFEYMASGKAIVASGVGQLLEVVQDGINSLLVPPGDTSEMAKALNQLIEDDDLRLRLGQRARKDAIAKHSWDQYIANLEDLFATVIDQKSR